MGTIKIIDYMDEKLISLNLCSKNKDDLLKEVTELISNSEKIRDKKEILDALQKREQIGSTGIGKGVAIPHAKTEAAESLTIAFGLSKEMIDFKSLDSEKVNMFFIFASPLRDSQIYLKVLARISRLIRDEEFRKKIHQCKTPKDVIETIRAEEEGN
jgi:fructose-specific phosphotransferase system IIA component